MLIVKYYIKQARLPNFYLLFHRKTGYRKSLVVTVHYRLRQFTLYNSSNRQLKPFIFCILSFCYSEHLKSHEDFFLDFHHVWSKQYAQFPFEIEENCGKHARDPFAFDNDSTRSSGMISTSGCTSGRIFISEPTF